MVSAAMKTRIDEVRIKEQATYVWAISVRSSVFCSLYRYDLHK